MIRQPVSGGDYDAFVAAKSRVLAILSRQIAEAIRKVHGGR
jgi:uncharacterized lipoprotein YmbA